MSNGRRRGFADLDRNLLDGPCGHLL